MDQVHGKNSLFVGNIPEGVSGEELLEFLNQTLILAGLSEGPGDPAVAYLMNLDKFYCYVQFRSEYEATKALALDNVTLKGVNLEIKPSDLMDRSARRPGLKDIPSEEKPEVWRRTVHYIDDAPLDTPGPSFETVPPVDVPPVDVPPIEMVEIEKRVGNLQSCKIRVRNVPAGVTEVEMLEFFNALMKLSGFVSDRAEACRMTNDVAIVKFLTADDAKKAVAYDSVNFRGSNLAIERVIDEPVDIEAIEAIRALDSEVLPEEVLKADREDKVVHDPDCFIIAENVVEVPKGKLVAWVNKIMKSHELAISPRPLISAKKISGEHYCIVQLPSPKDATLALCLDGINYRGRLLRVSPCQGRKNKIDLGNLPNYVKRNVLRNFLDSALLRKGLTKNPRTVGTITKPRARYAFSLKFRSKEEAKRSLELSGVSYFGGTIVFRRPDTYRKENPSVAPVRVPTPPLISEGFSHIHVTNFPLRYSDELLRRFLNREMINRRLVTNPGDCLWPSPKSPGSNGKGRGFGFAFFKSPEEATYGLELDGMMFKGQRLKLSRPLSQEPVQEQTPKPVPTKHGKGFFKALPQDPAYKLHIANLTDSITQEGLKEFLNMEMRKRLLGRYNPVMAVVINPGAQFAIFQARTHGEAMSASFNLNGLELEGRKLRVKLISNPVPSEGPNTEKRIPEPATASPRGGSLFDPKKPTPPLLSSRPTLYEMNPSGPMYEKRVVSTPQVMYHSYQQEQHYAPRSNKNYQPENPATTFKANSFSSKYTWSIASWNVMGITSDPKVQAYIDENLFNLGIDLLAIQETQLSAVTMYTKHYKWYLSASKDGVAPGVGFLIRRDLLPCVYEWNPISGNLAHLQVKTSQQNLALVSVFVPSSSEPLAAVAMEELQTFVSRLCHDDHILLLGDFNAEIGKEDITKEDSWFIGFHLYHKHSNDNGDKLKTLLHAMKMYLFTTQWETTLFTSCVGTDYFQTDHLITNCDRLITSIRAIPMSSFRTFHKLLRASVRFTVCDQHRV